MRHAPSLCVLFSAFTLLCASACGGDEGGQGSDTDDGTPKTFQCGPDADFECDLATQYCVLVTAYAGDLNPGTYCLDKPESCMDCDCIDVEKDFTAAEQSTACSQGLISCSFSDGAIEATCQESGSL